MGVPFDPDSYIDNVLRRFRRSTDGRLPPLAVRYALDQWPADASDQDLIGRVGQVVDLWRRQQAGGTAGLAEVCERFLAADAGLRSQAGYQDPRWWRRQIRAAQQAKQPGNTGADRPAASSNVPPGLDPADPAAAAAPPAPTDLTISGGGDRVILQWQWQAPSRAPAEVTFTVERSGGTGAPQLKMSTSRTTIEDVDPPQGRVVTYRVFAVNAVSGARSRAAVFSMVLTPRIADLAARQVRDGSVMGHWRAHPDTWRVDLWRTPCGSPADSADRVVIEAGAGGFIDQSPPPGRHLYSVVPVYRDPNDDRTYAGPRSEVEVDVYDRPPRPRVSVYRSGRHEAVTVTLRWSELTAGVFLMMRRSAAEPAGSAGDVLMIEDAERIGEPVEDGTRLTGTTAGVTLPAGCWVLVPFAVAGSRAVRGASVEVTVVPPVTSPEAVRNGADVMVSWVWPKGLRQARVAWRGDGPEVPREVLFNDFQRLGGVSFRRSDAARIRITGIVRCGTDELTSESVTVRVSAQPPTLTFHVKRAPGFLGLLPWSRNRRVVLVTDLPCPGVRARIFVPAPRDSTHPERELAVQDGINLGPGRSQQVRVTIPRAGELARPSFVSCEATTSSGRVRVDDFGSTGRKIR